MLDELKKFLGRKPFEAFRIVSTSGAVYDVASRFQVAVGETKFCYYYPRSNRNISLDGNQITTFVNDEPANP